MNNELVLPEGYHMTKADRLCRRRQFGHVYTEDYSGPRRASEWRLGQWVRDAARRTIQAIFLLPLLIAAPFILMGMVGGFIFNAASILKFIF